MFASSSSLLLLLLLLLFKGGSPLLVTHERADQFECCNNDIGKNAHFHILNNRQSLRSMSIVTDFWCRCEHGHASWGEGEDVMVRVLSSRQISNDDSTAERGCKCRGVAAEKKVLGQRDS